jgi:homoserine O-acetyltransferase
MSLKKHHIKNFVNSGGKNYPDIELSYEVFGKKLGSAPVVLVNHALTGNSDVTSRNKGWWKEIVGSEKLIDLNRFTVVAFNVLGNGYDETYIHNYKNFSARDMAKLFLTALDDLGVAKLFAAIGGSLGGCIAWEMAALRPKLIQHLIPIAANFQANDWIIAHCFVQERILANSSNNIEDARIMAMLFYRSAASFRQKFNRSLAENEFQYNVESWLDHHGRKLRLRYTRHAYLMTNHLLRSVNILKDATFKDVIEPIESTIIQIGIDTDIFFVPEEMKQTQIWLDQLGKKNSYHEIKSIHGHDGFLIENDQITTILSPIFKQDIK